ncbi:connector protein [Clostridium phage CpV1]|uniref:Connector protein n=1 Tax=Clostridium phage CpV1 TaxID=926066 RepID=E5G066_9CAUD|nr:connector protein [Clostridium phage CpV1]ADR30486.1 connector protein [Clostridium phage CpV1]
MGKKRNINKVCADRRGLLFLLYKNLATNVFKWEGLPNGIESRHIENFLFEHGQVGFYNDENLGMICLPISNSGELNIYGDPTKFYMYSKNGNYSKTIPSDKVIRCMDNPNLVPTKSYVNYYVQEMLDIETAIRANLRKQVKPYFAIATDKNKYSVKSIIDDYENGEDVVIIDKTLGEDGFDGLKLLTANVEYLVDKLRAEERSRESALLTYLGVSNVNMEKKERLITDEVNGNEEFVNLNLSIRAKGRLDAMIELQKIYPGVKCVLNMEYLEQFFKSLRSEVIGDDIL